MNHLPPKILEIRANICNIKRLGHEMDFKNLDKKGQIYFSLKREHDKFFNFSEDPPMLYKKGNALLLMRNKHWLSAFFATVTHHMRTMIT